MEVVGVKPYARCVTQVMFKRCMEVASFVFLSACSFYQGSIALENNFFLSQSLLIITVTMDVVGIIRTELYLLCTPVGGEVVYRWIPYPRWTTLWMYGLEEHMKWTGWNGQLEVHWRCLFQPFRIRHHKAYWFIENERRVYDLSSIAP